MYRIQQTANTNQDGNNNSGADHLKQQMVNFIYSKVELSNFKFEMLEVESELPQLASKPYNVSVNFSGSSCLLVFAKIRDKYHKFLVDRKSLSYNSRNVDIKKVKINPVNVNVDIDIFQGTIFDGLYIQNKQRNENIFMITDVYLFKGQDFTKSHLESKLLTVRTYLESSYKADSKNDIIITVNKLFPLNKTRHLCDKMIPDLKKQNMPVKGLCFYPEVSGTKLLFRFGNENTISNNNANYSNNNANYSNNNANAYKNNNYSNNNATYTNTSQQQFNKSKYTNNMPAINDKDESGSDSCEIVLNGNGAIDMQNITRPVKKTKKVYVPKHNKSDETYVFEMKKTSDVDVYKLNVVEPVVKNSKTYLKRKQVCLALIPNIDRSKWCKNITLTDESNILVHCKFHKDKHKWEPVKLSELTKPSYINDFDTVEISA